MTTQTVVDVATVQGDDEIQIESSLADFRAQPGGLSPEERQRIVEQALVLIEDLYVHLPLKRAMHAVDPVQRLRLLQHRSDRLGDRAFHDELLSIFTSVRDLHTNYMLPDPFRTKVAFLPFLVEELHEDGRRVYIVSKLLASFTHDTFAVGVTVHHWNGVPFDRAVEINADNQAGSNEDARHARGLEAMTIRPLAQSLPPDEDFVVIGYTAEDGQDHQIRFDWQVFEPQGSPQGVDADDATDPAARALGLDTATEAVRRAKKSLFARKAMRTERAAVEAEATQALLGATATAGDEPAPPAGESVFPDVFAFREVETPSGRFGLIRIWTFNVRDPGTFVAEFVRIAALLPQNGLIVDVRGNGGGVILAGERLLQVLTPKPIEPCRLHFLNTPLTLRLARRNDFLRQWADSIAQAVETGASFSFGFPAEAVENANNLGQQYCGPVVLVTDALCYSTTDIFAAGFQDHAIGPILGTSGNTGAGGANVWTHTLLSQLLPGPDSPFQALPRNASFRVATRRTTRVGERSGVPLEDLGVVPDHLHHMTRRDVVGGNEDLIEAAAALLAARPVRALSAEVTGTGEGEGGGEGAEIGLRVTTGNLTRVDVFVDGRPRLSTDTTDGTVELRVPAGAGSHAIELRGYAGDELAAARRLRV